MMYRISYDNGDGEITFYSDKYPSDEYRVLDPNLTIKDSEAGSFTVNIPPTNIAYSELYRMKTNITIYDGEDEIWDGRLLSDAYDFNNNRSCTFEGGLAYLIDTSQPQMEYHDITLRQFVEAIISIHNQKVPENKQFVVGYISNNLLNGYGENYTLSYRATQFQSTLETLNSLVSDLQGHLAYSRTINSTTGKKERTIRILDEEDFSNNDSQSINFGENLLDFSKGYDMSALATVLVATGQRETSPDQAVPGDNVIVFESDIGTPTQITLSDYNALPDETKASGYYLITDDFYTTVRYQNPGDQSVTNWPVQRRRYKGSQVYLAIENTCMYNTKINNQDRLNFKVSESNYYLSEPIKIEAGKTYFLSYRVDKAKQYVMYIIARSGDLTSTQNILEYKAISNSGEYGVEDSIKTSITMPEGATHLFICGLGKDIPIQCQESKESLEKLDTYLTIRGAEGSLILPDGATLIDKKPGTTEWLTKDYYENSISDSDKKNESNWFYLWDVDQLLHWYQDDTDEWVEGKFKDGIYMINPYMVSEYGWIEKSASWDDVEDSETLMLYSFAYLFREQWDNLTINITAFDLRMLGVSASQISRFNLYQRAYITSKPHGIDLLALPINELSIPLLNPESTTFSLGYSTETSFTEASNKANTDILTQLLAVPTFSETVQSAKDNATDLINMATTGTITLLQTENGPDELLIHDGPNGNYHLAGHMWRWNINGLKFGQAQNPSSPGYDEAYNSIGVNTPVAITMDGAIAANYITTGFMHADRIRGGTLDLGGYNQSGEIIASGKMTIYRADSYTPGTPQYLLLVGDTGNYDNTFDASKYGVSVKSLYKQFGQNWAYDVVQLDDGHLYFYMSDQTGDHIGETKHKKAIGQIFTARGQDFDGSVNGVALDFQAPFFEFNGLEPSGSMLDTTLSVRGKIQSTTGYRVFDDGSWQTGASNNSLDIGGKILTFHKGLFCGASGNYSGGWTDGSSSLTVTNNITIGQTSLNETQLTDLLNLLNNQNGSGGSGGGSGSGTALTIGNTSIDETQLQALLALISGGVS